MAALFPRRMFVPAVAATLVLGAVARAASPAETNWIDAGGARIVEPPAEHPRLYLRATHLADVRRRMSHPVLKPVWDELQALAQHNPQTRLELDALRYLLDREGDLARRTTAEASRLIQQVKLAGEKPNNSRRIGRMMVTAAMPSS